MNAALVILVVGSSADTLARLAAQVTACGYAVVTAEGRDVALASIAAHVPALVLIDVSGGAEEGYELCRRLKAQDDTRHTPVLFSSDCASGPERARGLNLGAVDFLTMPIHDTELDARLRLHVASHQPRQPAQWDGLRDIVLDTLDAHVAVVDAAGRIVAVNEPWRCFARNGGVMELDGTVEGVNYLEVTQRAVDSGEEYAGAVLNGLRDILAGRASEYRCEYPCHGPTEMRWFSMVARPLAAGAGGALITHADITARKEAERALSQSAELFSTVFRAAPVIMALSRLDDGTYLDVNAEFERLSGFTHDQAVGKSSVDLGLINAVDRANVILALEARGSVRDMEVTLTAKGGRRLTCLLNGETLRVGTRTCLLSLLVDITERRRVEQELTRANDRLGRAQRCSGGGVWDWDMTTGILDWSPELYRLFGIDPSAGKASFDVWHKALHPQDLQLAEARIAEAVRDHKPLHNEYRIVLPSGETRWILALGDTAYADRGEPLRMSGICLDITERYRYEIALRESEARFRTYLENAPDGVFVIDRDGRYLFANPAACRLTGYTDAELRAMQTLDLVPQRGQERVRDRVRTLAATGRLSEETVYRRKDGTEFDAELEAAALPDGNYVGFVKDVSERKRAERALAESEGQVRAKLDAILSPEGDLGALQLADVLDVPGIQALMDQFFKLTGIGVGIIDDAGKVLVGTGWQDVCTRYLRVHPETRKNCIESDSELSSGVQAGTFKRYKCKNNLWDIATPIVVGGQHLGNLFLGQFFYDDETPDEDYFRQQARRCGFDATEYLAAVSRIPRWSHATVDAAMAFYMRFSAMVSALSWSNIQLARTVAERERAEAALRASEGYFRTLAESSFEGLVMTEGGLFVDCNSQFATLVGSSRAALLGRPLLDFVAPDSRDTVAEAVRNEDLGPYTCFIQTERGEPIQVEVRARMVNVGERRIRIAAIQDIRHLKQAEAARVDLERSLLHAQKLESLGVLAGGIAHDFNNLLTVIMGNLVLAVDELALSSPVLPLLDQAIASSRRARDLTRQMLAYSGRGAFLVQSVDLNALVEENAHLFRSAVPRTIEFLLQLGRQPALVEADPGQVQQVVMNLITNAAEAIEKSGTIRVSTRVATFGAAELEASRLPDKPAPGRFACLEVADDGCGMDESIQEKLFDPFFTTKFAGRGLGMAALLGVVRGHKGAVLVSSTPGRGTVIQVLFPAFEGPGAEAVPKASPRTAARKVSGLPGVLLIDDEPQVLRVARLMLERAGHTVYSANGAARAVTLLTEHGNDIGIAVIDLSMPTKDGLATLTELREIRSGLPAVLCSGFAEQELQGRIEGLPLIAFLQKPYERAHLQTAIATLLEEARRVVAAGEDDGKR